MDRISLSVPEIAIIGSTRGALGAGIGLLVASRLNEDQRRAVGWTLLGVGVVTTIPILIQLARSMHDGRHGEEWREDAGVRGREFSR